MKTSSFGASVEEGLRSEKIVRNPVKISERL